MFFVIFKSFCRYRSLKADIPASLVSRITSTYTQCKKSDSHFYPASVRTQNGGLFVVEGDSHCLSLPSQNFFSSFFLIKGFSSASVPAGGIERERNRERNDFLSDKNRRGVRRPPSLCALNAHSGRTNNNRSC